MDIDNVLNCMINAKKDNFKETEHFKIKLKRRRDKLPNHGELISTLEGTKPVGILKQNEEKFKLYYELDERYDIVIIISVKSVEPISINLITTFPEKRSKRERE